MAHRILKVTPDEDLYVSWSTITDSPLWWGTREEILNQEVEDDREKEPYARPRWEEAFERADRTGTSQMAGWDGWGDEGDVLVFEQRGLLKRSDLKAFLDTYDEKTQHFDLSFLQPFEDGREVVGYG